jgi:Transposase and inactivated derivatives
MIFEEENLYHIYNQGNNRQSIFFSRDNYLFFLKKVREYILPHADILAWCLMPNHFHLMVYLHTLVIDVDADSDGFTQSETVTKHKQLKQRDFNASIGLMLRSYTRAINKQEDMSGSLFRSSTKAQCLTKQEGLTPAYFSTAFGTQINTHYQEQEYPQVCFNYIHLNPTSANLVKDTREWEFSSAIDYLGIRNGKLINKNRLKEFGIEL